MKANAIVGFTVILVIVVFLLVGVANLSYSTGLQKGYYDGVNYGTGKTLKEPNYIIIKDLKEKQRQEYLQRRQPQYSMYELEEVR